jgi:glycosyltransferase involved in cell wall biosynthesis
MLQGRDIVCFSSLDWSAMWGTAQQIMHRLAKSNRVLFVEEPVTMLAPFKVPGRWRRWGATVPRLHQREAGLWTLTPPPLLPFGNMRAGINSVNQALMARSVLWATDRLSFGEDYLLWTYLPASQALLDRLQAQDPREETQPLVVYHCVDEHAAFPGYFVSPEVVRGYDDGLTRRADLVITTAENLRRSREALNPQTHTVLNAADVEIFNRALDPNLPLPGDLAAIPTPRLGVVGVHDYRLDIDALEALAQADPSWQIVLVGPVKSGQVDEARLRRLPTVHLLGPKPRSDLPMYLKGLDVALVPYRASELTRNIFPLKLFEYLAAGLPVVAGGLPELDRFSGIIEVAEKIQDYPGLVRAAIAEDGPEKRAARVALAAENTWDRRVEEISFLVDAALKRKGLS